MFSSVSNGNGGTMDKPKLIPYCKIYDGYAVMLHKLRPTGRYKFVTSPYEANALYVEHISFSFLGIKFTKWIHEDNILFLNECKEEIINCNRR